MVRASKAEVEASLDTYLQVAKGGEEVVVTEGGEPVAKLVPYRRLPDTETLQVCRPRSSTAPRPGDIVVQGIEPKGTDSTALLRELRDKR